MTLRDNHPKGLGVRELKRKTSEKCVRFKLPNLLADGFAAIKNPKARRGQKKIVIITEKGLKDTNLLRQMNRMEEQFKKTYNIRSFDELQGLSLTDRLALYERVLMDSFNLCLDCNAEVAMRFIRLTLHVFRKVLDKKKYDLETMKRFYEVIHKTLSEKEPSG